MTVEPGQVWQVGSGEVPDRKGQVWHVPFKGGDTATVVKEPTYVEEHGAWFHVADSERNGRAGFPESVDAPWERLPGFRCLS